MGQALTSFYSTSGFCTPSRASLLTGCYPRRVSMHWNHTPPGDSKMRQVLFPVARKGLHPNEITIADTLKTKGYATACIGKWHLGDQKVFLPTRQGFDHYFGIPYSNDMGAAQFPINPPLPLLKQEDVVEAPVDQSTITRRYTLEALTFIEEHRDQPFFLYLPHTMPHHPVNSSSAFNGKSANSGYGDCVEEIDWSTGQILSLLKELDLDEKTLVLFTSDNGAAKRWGGSNKPLSGHKGSTMEGGMRVPCIVRWPGQIPAGAKSWELTSTLDLLPTLTGLVEGKNPEAPVIDGKDIWPILSGQNNAKSPYEAFYYYDEDQLQAVRSGSWKLHLARKANEQPRLYDLDQDIAESENMAKKHPDIVSKLTTLADRAREELGDRGKPGSKVRAAGFVNHPKPLVKG